MNHAQQFSEIMRYLWDDKDHSVSFTIRAIGDRLMGTQRCNYENAFDVLDRVFGENVRLCAPRPEQTEDGAFIFDVEFDDDSSCMIVASNGIGSRLE